MIDILALLKRIEWTNHECRECYNSAPYIDNAGEKQGGYHAQDCQLKAAIDALESLALVVVETGLDEA